MALRTDTLVLFTTRFLTLFFACASLKIFVYDPTNDKTSFPMSALSSLELALGCHITACVVQLVGLLVSFFKGWAPLPGDRSLRFSVILLDLVLAMFTMFCASSAVGVIVDFAFSKQRKLWHGGLACLTGLSGFASTLYSYLITIGGPALQQPHP